MANELNILPEHTSHPRSYRESVYVYPVLSRRSKGISIGVNLNPDKACNFDCVYCQVDRTTAPTLRKVDVDRLLVELELTLDAVTSGELFEDPAFAKVPQPLRRLNDIAFSGDGEPTAEAQFAPIIEKVAELKRRKGLHDVKLVLITNATLFDRPKVTRALDLLMENRGEIWAKLDAGTEDYYHLIERTSIPFARVLGNILSLAQRYPLVIQTMFLRYDKTPPSEAEITAYIERLRHVMTNGGQLKLVQIYTVARTPAESIVSALSSKEVDQIVHRVRDELGVAVEAYYGNEN